MGLAPCPDPLEFGFDYMTQSFSEIIPTLPFVFYQRPEALKDAPSHEDDDPGNEHLYADKRCWLIYEGFRGA